MAKYDGCKRNLQLLGEAVGEALRRNYESIEQFAAAILVLVGLVGGMIPAIRASRLDPIEALRYE